MATTTPEPWQPAYDAFAAVLQLDILYSDNDEERAQGIADVEAQLQELVSEYPDNDMIARIFPSLIRVSRECPFLDSRLCIYRFLQQHHFTTAPTSSSSSSSSSYPPLLTRIHSSLPYPLELIDRLGPSLWVTPAECRAQTSQAGFTALADIAIASGRVSNMDRVIAWHPTFLIMLRESLSFVMRRDGPLPVPWRHYIAIMACARFGGQVLVAENELEYLTAGGDLKWLQGIAAAPTKLQVLVEMIALLGLCPWKLDQQHITRLTNEGWNVAELVHAVVIISTFTSLSTFCHGMGVIASVDLACKTHAHRILMQPGVVIGPAIKSSEQQQATPTTSTSTTTHVSVSTDRVVDADVDEDEDSASSSLGQERLLRDLPPAHTRSGYEAASDAAVFGTTCSSADGGSSSAIYGTIDSTRGVDDAALYCEHKHDYNVQQSIISTSSATASAFTPSQSLSSSYGIANPRVPVTGSPGSTEASSLHFALEKLLGTSHETLLEQHGADINAFERADTASASQIIVAGGGGGSGSGIDRDGKRSASSSTTSTSTSSPLSSVDKLSSQLQATSIAPAPPTSTPLAPSSTTTSSSSSSSSSPSSPSSSIPHPPGGISNAAGWTHCTEASRYYKVPVHSSDYHYNSARYEVFDVSSSSSYKSFHLDAYNWKDHGLSLLNRLYPGSAALLDQQTDLITSLTYRTLRHKLDVDTSPFRAVIWYFTQRLFGIRKGDYRYENVSIYLRASVRSFVRKMATDPESLTADDFAMSGYSFTVSEKCHIALLVAEARRQATLLYGLRTIMQHLNG